MITAKEAREQALSFLSQQGLERDYIENLSIKLDRAEKLIEICREKKPQNILEIGSFVGVSTAVLGLCLPEAQIVCIDVDTYVGLHNLLCRKKFKVKNHQQTSFYFVEKLLNRFGISTRVVLKRGFFSGILLTQKQLDLAALYGAKLEHRKVIGPEVCLEYGPFDLAFLDADHRKEAVKQDLMLLSSFIKPGGAIALDDVGSDYWGQQVRQGVEQFLEKNPQKGLTIEGEIGLISTCIN